MESGIFFLRIEDRFSIGGLRWLRSADHTTEALDPGIL